MRGVSLRFLLVVCFALTTIPFSLAADRVIYDGWHFSEDSFSVDGETFAVSHFRFTDDRIILNVNSKSYLIQLGDCAETVLKRYCFQEIYNNISGATHESHIKFDGREVFAGLRINMSARDSALELTRTFSTTTPLKGEEVRVDLVINNPTDFYASEFSYLDEYPEGVVVTSGSGDLDKRLHSVSYKRSIPPKTQKVYSYNIRMNDYFAFTNTASYSYVTEGSAYNLTTPAYSADLTDKKPFLLSMALARTSFEVGDESPLTISILNRKTTDLEINALEIFLSSENLTISLNPEDVGDFKSSTGKKTWSGVIASGQTTSFTIQLKTSSPGKYNIPLALSVKDNGNTNYIEKKNASFTTTFKEPEIILSIKDTVISEGGVTRAAFSVKNPNTFIALRNVKVKLTGPMLEPATGAVDEIPPGDVKTLIVQDNIIGPQVFSDTNFVINASGTYETRFTKKSFSKAVNVKVTPVNKSVSIIQKLIKPAQLVPGSNVTVEISLKYLNEERIEVSAQDYYSKDAIFNGGLDFGKVTFDKSETKKVYSYNLIIPRNYSIPELGITTSVSIEGKADKILMTVLVPVNISKSDQLPFNRSTDLGLNSTAVPEKEGAIAKVVNGVTNFFRRLLGFNR